MKPSLSATFKNLLNGALRSVLAWRRPSKQANFRRMQERGETLDAFIIREATADDIPELATLHAKTWAETYWSVKNPPTAQLREQQWREQFDHADGSWFCLLVSDAQGRLIGFAKGQAYAHPDLPDYSGELNKIYLLREYQRLGLGSRLIREVARRFLSKGISNMVLFGVPQNPSCRFHEAMGGEKLYDKQGVFQGGYGWINLSEILLHSNT